MKITANEVTALRSLIERADTTQNRARYTTGDFARANAVKDLDKRYRWDLFWDVRGYAVLTGEYNDSHIDTALRSIVAPL